MESEPVVDPPAPSQEKETVEPQEKATPSTQSAQTTAAGKYKRNVSQMVVAETPQELQHRKNFDERDLMVEFDKLICTKCGLSFVSSIDNGESHCVTVHPLLKVLFCSDCLEFYGDGNFSVDEDEDDKYCRWCGQGGTIMLCSKCVCSFCIRCIRRNLGSKVLKKFRDDDNWICLICNPQPLWKLRHLAYYATRLALANQKQVHDTMARDIDAFLKTPMVEKSHRSATPSAEEKDATLNVSVASRRRTPEPSVAGAKHQGNDLAATTAQDNGAFLNVPGVNSRGDVLTTPEPPDGTTTGAEPQRNVTVKKEPSPSTHSSIERPSSRASATDKSKKPGHVAKKSTASRRKDAPKKEAPKRKPTSVARKSSSRASLKEISRKRPAEALPSPEEPLSKKNRTVGVTISPCSVQLGELPKDSSFSDNRDSSSSGSESDSDSSKETSPAVKVKVEPKKEKDAEETFKPKSSHRWKVNFKQRPMDGYLTKKDGSEDAGNQLSRNARTESQGPVQSAEPRREINTTSIALGGDDGETGNQKKLGNNGMNNFNEIVISLKLAQVVSNMVSQRMKRKLRSYNILNVDVPRETRKLLDCCQLLSSVVDLVDKVTETDV